MGSRENVAMCPVQRKSIYQIHQFNFSCLFLFFHLTSTLLLNVSNTAVRLSRFSHVLSQNSASEESISVLEEDTEQIKSACMSFSVYNLRGLTLQVYRQQVSSCLKKNQPDAQLILNIFRQILQVSWTR